MIDFERREIMKMFALGFGGAILLSCPTLASAMVFASRNAHIVLEKDYSIYYTSGPRVLWLKREKDEFLIDVYMQEGYKAFSWATRDIRAGNVVGTPDARLVRQLVWIQGRLVAKGYNHPLIITSGLRTPETNRMTENASLNSYHLPVGRSKRFRAVDMKMDHIKSSVIYQTAIEARDGGVGFYGEDGHVHTDVGPVRRWNGKYYSKS